MPTHSSTLSPKVPVATTRAGLLLVVLVIFGGLFGGCSTYRNMTAYFNTYYNAGKLFDDAVTEVANTAQPARDSNYFAPPVVPATAITKFEKVIEKSSKLIQFYPESGLIRGAILMIGKSYAYQAEYDPAIRKFEELLKNFPEADERFEAKLWLARARYGEKNTDEALRLVKELFPEARAEGKDEIMQEALMLEAQIYVDRQEFDQAAATYAVAVEISGGGDRRAWSQYQLGLAYEKTKSYAKAADAYLGVRDYRPSLSLGFRSRLKHGMMLSAVGLHKDAIASLEDLIDEQLRPEEFALADLEIANAYWALGDTAEANGLYTFVDTTYRRTDAAAKSLYRRGTIYESQFSDFQKASEYYARAKNEFPASEVTPLAQKKSENFTAYFQIKRNTRMYDSLLARMLTPDSVLARLDSLARAADTTKKRLPQSVAEVPAPGTPPDVDTSRAPDSGGIVPPPPNPQIQLPEQVTKRAPTPRRQALAGREDMKSRRQHLNDIDEDEGEEQPTLAKNSLAKGDSTGKKRSVAAAAPAPAKPVTPDSMRSLVAKSNFELASLFFLQMGYPDSALYYYGRVLQENPSSSYAPKVLYSMAEVYRTKGDSAMVDTLYAKILRDHGASSYADQVRRGLGITVAPKPVDPSVLRFAHAESLLVDGKTVPALRALKQIAKAAPSASSAKAMYTIGWVYENVVVDQDSASVWYRTLLASYPDSIYSKTAGPKIAVKDDPATLDKYVKIKKIDAVAKPAKPTFGRHVQVERARRPGEDEKGLRSTDPDQDPDEEEDQEQDQDEDQDPDEPDDGGVL